jgi:hypothetical protein
MKRIAPLAALVPLLLAACGPERPSVPEFMEIAGEILAFAEQDARESQPGRASDGPLYVNVGSFQAGAERATRQRVPQDSVARALGQPVHAAMEQVTLCDSLGTVIGCWVRQYGIWINLNLVRVGGGELTAYVRSLSTDRRAHPTDFCSRVWRLDYRHEEGEGWRLAERTLLRSCATAA